MRLPVIRLFSLAVVSMLGACGGDSPTEPSLLPCQYTVRASATAFQASGGTGTVDVAAESRCSWTARADASWLSISSGASGSGAGVVGFAVAANAETTSRTGALTIAERQIPITQEGAVVPCTYSIAPSNAAMGSDGGTGTFSITAGATCPWTAVSDASWLAVTDGREGTGSGRVAYSVASNSDTSGRTATITVGGQVFTLTQSGEQRVCEYSVSPVVFSPCMPSAELISQVATQSGCPWTAAAGASWLTITAGESGSGSGTLRFRISDNYDAPRNGVVMVRWPSPTAGQNLQIRQAGCFYGVSRDAFAFDAAGGPATFDVLQQSEPIACGGATQDRCVWAARADAGWITVTSSMPRAGDDRVSFTVAANDSAASRTGTIAVRDKVVRITQAGR